MKHRTILIVIVLLLGTFNFPSIGFTNQGSTKQITPTNPQILNSLIKNNYVDPLITNYSNTGNFPSSVKGNGILIVSHKPLDYLGNVIPPLKIQGTYIYITDVTSQTEMKQIQLDPNVKSIMPNYYVNFTSSAATQPTLGTQSFLAKDILQTAKTWDTYGIDGTGVKIGIVDSGVDFGVSDLSSAALLTSDGITASFDPTGAGLGLANLTIQPITTERGLVLPLSQHNITIWTADQATYETTDQIGLQLSDLRIDGIAKPSVSGNYKVGIMFEPGFQSTIVNQYFIFVLTDSVTAGLYDTLYVDFSTSLGISLARQGIILPSGQTYLNLVDWDLSDEPYFNAGNPIIARDFNGDGVNDVSMGALSTTLDIYGVVHKNPLVDGVNARGISPDGAGIAVMYDPVGHGTLVASAAASRGQSGMLLFDNKDTPQVENNTAYYLPGSAPGASLVVSKGFTINDFILGWYWVAGFEVTVSNGNLVWDTTPESLAHRVDIASNSWGIADIAYQNSLKGMDYYSLLLDAFSAPDLIYDNYPGIIFVVAMGNGGPGFGTIATPGAASMAITVGASTYYHFLDNNGKNDMAWFSSRGPTPYGAIKPDIVTPGHTGYVNYQVNTGYGNGTRAAGTFGGTSEATPRASGIIALIIEAMRQNSITPDLGNVRVTLKSNAIDLGYPAAIQGAGLANAYDSVSAIMDGVLPLFETNQTALFLGERLNNAFGDLFVDKNNNSLPHPLLTHPYMDTFIVTNSTNLVNSQALYVNYINGTQVNNTLLTSDVTRMELVDQSSFTFNTKPQLQTSVDLSGLWSLQSNWRDNALLQISLSLTESSWNELFQYGLSTPNLFLIDNGTKNIISDLTSEYTWVQQMYSGNPKTDFYGKPVIQLTDPGVENEIPGWNPLTYQVKVMSYGYVNTSILSVPELGAINISSSQINNYEFTSLDVSYNQSRTYNLPILIANEEIVKYAANADIVSGTLNKQLPYDLNTYFGSFDWGYRPESGDFRFYYLQIPSNATFLAIHATWSVDGFIPDLYLFSGNGSLVATSNVKYVVGGLYNSIPSETHAQNLLVPAETQNYILLVHVVHMPFSPEPVKLSVLTRYLTVDSIPPPDITFQPTITNPISSVMSITASSFNLPQFPELKVNGVAAQVMQGENGTTTRTILGTSIIISDTISIGAIEDNYGLFLHQGEKVHLHLQWTASVDLDMYVFKAGEPFQVKNDLLSQQGTSANKYSEDAFLTADTDGNYIVYIDVAAVDQIVNVKYTLSWDSRDGPTIQASGNSLQFDTGIFPNGVYDLKITLSTNFNIQFVTYAEVTFDNYVNFTSSLLSPNTGKISGDVDVSWTSLRPVSADIMLIINQAQVLVKQDVTSTSTTFDSTLYPNGPATLRVILTDGVYVHIHDVSVTIDNSNPSSLPPSQKTNNRSLPTLSFMFAALVLIVMAKTSTRKKRFS